MDYPVKFNFFKSAYILLIFALILHNIYKIIILKLKKNIKKLIFILYLFHLIASVKIQT